MPSGMGRTATRRITPARHVADTLAALSPDEQLACLWHLAGFSNKEIAEQLGTTSEHVEMTLRNATNEVPEASLR